MTSAPVRATPPVLARLVTWLVWGSVILTAAGVIAQTAREEAVSEPLALGLFSLLLLALFLGLPAWRYVTWLRRVAVDRATDADRVHVQRWAAALQWLILAGLAFLLASGWSKLTGRVQSGETWESVLFGSLGAVVIVGLLVQLRRWVDIHTRTQADASARASGLTPLLSGLVPWVRAGQLSLLVGLPLTLGNLEFAWTLVGVVEGATTVLVPLLDLLVLEFSLRFARASAAPPLTPPAAL